MARRKKSLVKTIYKVMAIQFVLGLLALIVIELMVIFALRYGNRIRPDSVLVLRVRGVVTEEAPQGLFADASLGQVTVLSDLLEALDRAAGDDRINGVVLRPGSFSMNMGKIQELRDKIRDFNRSGKFTAAFLESADNRSYYLATACESISFVPHSILAVKGMMAQATFLRGTLDLLGVRTDVIHTGDYKTSANYLTEKGYTAAHREATRKLLEDWYDGFISGLGEGRQIFPKRMAELVAEGPFTSGEALEAGLVDRLAYRDEFADWIKQKNNGSENRVGVSRYLARSEGEGNSQVAVVYTSGTITTGESRENMLLGRIAGSTTVSEHLRRAREDESYKAVILRVDSPGGSVIASEIMRREVSLTQMKKPVVVSMSDVAASGGYWISMGADRIVAQPGTVTGSIGVIAMKPNLRGLYEKMGMTKDYVAMTENATLEWPFESFTPKQRAKLKKIIDGTYDTFLRGVSEGRSMELDKVKSIAQGRVWTGVQARSLGLVDALGGMDKAVEIAKQLAEIPEDEKVRLVHITTRTSLLEKISEMMNRFAGSSSSVSRTALLEAARTGIAPLLEETVWAVIPSVPEVQ